MNWKCYKIYKINHLRENSDINEKEEICSLKQKVNTLEIWGKKKVFEKLC